MPDEKKPDGPFYPPTTRLPKVEVPQSSIDAVLSEVRAMRSETTERFDKIETTVDTLVEDGKAANKRMTSIEIRMDQIEDRGTKYSGGVRQLSETDARHEQAIAEVITKQDATDKKVDAVLAKTDAQTVMLTEAKAAATAVWKNPAVRVVASAIWAAFLYWLGSKGIKVPQ